MSDDRPAWARRIAAERTARDWSLRDAVRALGRHTGGNGPAEASMIRQWASWESGQAPPDSWRPLIAAVFGTVTSALFPESARRDGEGTDLTASDMETRELIERLKRRDTNAATLDALQATTQRLCSAYAFLPSEQLLNEGRQWLRRVMQLLSGNLSLTHHRQVLALAGRLALLVGCVEYDSGDGHGAESTRQVALSLATESAHAEIGGWAHEMRAWFALTAGDYRQVIVAARTGAQVAAGHGVAVQLAAQEAKAWARLDDRRQMEAALDRGRRLLEAMPPPKNPEDHFVVDPAKFDFYAMDCYRRIGEDRLARTLAEEVLRVGTELGGAQSSPMRNAEARITLAVTGAREGDLEQALQMGERALEGERRSLPSLLLASRELAAELKRLYASEPATQDYLARLRELEQG